MLDGAQTDAKAAEEIWATDGALDRTAPVEFLAADELAAVWKGDKFRISLYKVLLFQHVASAIKSGSLGAILLNDELASAEDREGGNGDTQHYILSPSDMVEAAALAAAGSSNGLFMTFVNDGRSQHTFLIKDYDPATATFTYSDTTGQHSLLEAGNNLAGVEAVRGPGGWQVKKDQLKTVLSPMIVGKAEVAKASGIVHFGPFGAFGNTPDDAKATNFFTWFHLTETARSATPGGGTTISYGPDSAKFRPLVTVRLNLALLHGRDPRRLYQRLRLCRRRGNRL